MKFNKKLFIPSIFAICTYLASYTLPKIIVSIDRYNYLSSAFDESIPFVALFMPIYILAFFQWANGILFLCTKNTDKAYRFLSAIIIGSIIGFVIYLIYPTSIIRPAITGTTLLDRFSRLVYAIDYPSLNSFPSFHCFCSTMVVFILVYFKADKKAIAFNTIYTLLVYVSTLFTKQHVVIDIPGGIALAFIAVFISKYIRFDSLFNKLNNKLLKQQ